MKIIVCIKQVPDTTDVKINPETNTLMREGVAAVINPYDMYAIEESLRIKTRIGGDSTVTALTMGPPQAEAALREAISLGVDKGILLCDRAFAGADTWATSYTLAQAIKHLGGADIILFGKQASDGDTAQVGPGVATHLDLPQITYVRKILELDNASISAQRMLEEGNETIRASLPCVLTVVKELNEPRLPSLKGKMASKRAEITVWKAEDIGCDVNQCGLNGSPTKVIRIFTPSARTDSEILTGEPQDTVGKLVDKLMPIIIGAAN